MEVLCLTALFLPVLTGFITGCLKQDKLRNSVVLISLLMQVLVVLMLIMHPVSEFELLRFTDSIALVFGVDVISMIFLLLISVLWLMAAIYSFEYMKHEDHRPRYYLFYMLTLAALMGLSMAKNLVTMYLCYEMMTLLSVPLVLHTQSKEAISAGLKYLGYSVFGAGLGLLGIFFINHFAATLAFVPGGSLIPELAVGNENLLYTVYLLMMIGFGCKAGMFRCMHGCRRRILLLLHRRPRCCPVLLPKAVCWPLSELLTLFLAHLSCKAVLRRRSVLA